MSEAVIELDRFGKSYSDVVAVDELTFSVEKGMIFGFLGANGAGKTTTIRMLCGLVRPTRGQAQIAGFDCWTQRSRVREKFGYVAQRFSLYRDLTAEENLRFFGGASRVPAHDLPQRIDRLLSLTDLKEKRHAPAGSLSGGMRQLLALGCALIHDPPLLFLDEPTSGLDPVHRQQIWNLLYDLSHRGITIFVTTHYMDEAERCTDVGFIASGRLLAKATPRGLIRSFKAKVLEMQVEPAMDALAKFREHPEILGVSLRSGSVRIYSPDAEKLVHDWRQHWPFPELQWRDCRWVEPDMEDVFTAYSQGYTAVLNPICEGCDIPADIV
ncbi:MAG: ABC transporter ATP-binding protein [Chthoniobacterales bacterium]